MRGEWARAGRSFTCKWLGTCTPGSKAGAHKGRPYKMYRQTHSGEPTEESRLAYEGRLFDVRVDKVRLESGRRTKREIVVVRGDSVSVVPVDRDGNVYLVRQYRKPPELLLLEVVAGGIDEGESAEEAARRELREEAGLRAEKLELLSFFWMSPGFCTEGMHAYLATGLSLGESAPEDDESIEVVRVRLEDVPGLIASGELQDCKSIAALMLALGRV